MATAAGLRMEIKEVLAEIAREAAEREAEAQAAAREAELKAAARYEKEMKETREQAEKEWQEIHEQIREQMKSPSLETEWKIKAVAKEYFGYSLSHRTEFAHEQFGAVACSGEMSNGTYRVVIDMVMQNLKSIALFEVKYQPHLSDIQTLLEKKEKFRKIVSSSKDKTIYLGIAGLSFPPEVETATLDAGIAVIKQVGDNLVVLDELVKKF